MPNVSTFKFTMITTRFFYSFKTRPSLRVTLPSRLSTTVPFSHSTKPSVIRGTLSLARHYLSPLSLVIRDARWDSHRCITRAEAGLQQDKAHAAKWHAWRDRFIVHKTSLDSLLGRLHSGESEKGLKKEWGKIAKELSRLAQEMNAHKRRHGLEIKVCDDEFVHGMTAILTLIIAAGLMYGLH